MVVFRNAPRSFTWLTLAFLALTFGTTALAGDASTDGDKGEEKEDGPPGDPRCPKGMAYIPGGTYRMGGKGKPVTVKPFCIDRTEVTAWEYEGCVDRELCSESGSKSGFKCTFGAKPTHPINCITWNQAKSYCEARRKRLPTEAEWEWAARGGPAGNRYPWGNDPPSNQLCWSGPGSDLPKDLLDRGTCPVERYPRDVTPQGVKAMGGNVGEWTATSAGKGKRIVRGGYWADDASKSLLVANREPTSMSEHTSGTGFRCASDPLLK